MTTLTVQLNPFIELTDEQFYRLCQANRELRFERTATGELIIMAPAGGETGNRNAGLTAQLWFWNETTQLGLVFDSSTGFKLPNGADRSPDLAWVKRSRWDALTQEQKEQFIPLCPDFVVELLSPSDSLKTVQAKMGEYQENGAHLGWLINRKLRQVEIYRLGQPVEVVESPSTLLGEAVLPEFTLRLDTIW